MTTEEAIAVLNEKEYGDSRKWRIYDPLSSKKLISGTPYPKCGFTEFETVAIAEKLIRGNE